MLQYTGKYDIPCWKGTILDPRQAATCENPMARLRLRWRLFADKRCRTHRDGNGIDSHARTTPRVGNRRPLLFEDAPPEAAPHSRSLPAFEVPILASPKISIIENFLSDEEIAAVMDLGLPNLRRSLAGGRVESIRSSSTAYLSYRNSTIKTLIARAAHISGYPVPHIEPLQFLKYETGQKYMPHYDFGEACDFKENAEGRRTVTMLLYLNSLQPDQGGLTVFPRLDIAVTPRARSAIIFDNILANGEGDTRTQHGGNPPTGEGEKFAVNVWIRSKPLAGPLMKYKLSHRRQSEQQE